MAARHTTRWLLADDSLPRAIDTAVIELRDTVDEAQREPLSRWVTVRRQKLEKAALRRLRHRAARKVVAGRRQHAGRPARLWTSPE